MPDNSKEQALDPIVPLAKAEGAFLALAAGDALGWPQEMPRRVRRDAGGATPSLEFRTWTRRNGGRFHPYDETIGAGEYSDDTQLTLAVARSRTHHGSNWWKAFMQVELPRWTIYERGGGGATKRGGPGLGDRHAAVEVGQGRCRSPVFRRRRQRRGDAGTAARPVSGRTGRSGGPRA